jgi:hypothetical protein
LLIFTIALFLFIVVAVLLDDLDFSREPIDEIVVPRDKVYFAVFTARFDGRIVHDGEEHILPMIDVSYALIPGFAMFDPFYDELIFVHSEADAVGFPDNVVTAWPGLQSQGVVANSMFFVYYFELDLVDFGLQHPLTTSDLVNNWEQSNELVRYVIDRRDGPSYDSRDSLEAIQLRTEILLIAGNAELYDEVRSAHQRGSQSLRFSLQDTFDLLQAAGSAEAYLALVNRYFDELYMQELTVEELVIRAKAAG